MNIETLYTQYPLMKILLDEALVEIQEDDNIVTVYGEICRSSSTNWYFYVTIIFNFDILQKIEVIETMEDNMEHAKVSSSNFEEVLNEISNWN